MNHDQIWSGKRLRFSGGLVRGKNLMASLRASVKERFTYLIGIIFWITIYFDPIIPVALRFGLIIALAGASSFALIIGKFNEHKNKQLFVVLIMGIFLFGIFQFVNSLNNNVYLEDAVPFVGLLFVPVFLLLWLRGYGSAKVLDACLPVSGMFSLMVLGIASLFFIRPDIYALIIAGLAGSRGAYGSLPTLNGDQLANVSFPATLLLVPAGVLAMVRRKWVIYFLDLLALFAAFSRFGAFVLLSFSIINALWSKTENNWQRKSLFVKLAKKHLNRRTIKLALVSLVVLGGIAFSMSIGKSKETDGYSIRKKHIESVANEFYNHPFNLIFGFGAGSKFYTTGFGLMANNIEISQVELFRKYGIFGFLVINWYIFAAARIAARKNDRLHGLMPAIVCYYLVSFSNPVLLSSGGLALFTLPYACIFEPSSKSELDTGTPCSN